MEENTNSQEVENTEATVENEQLEGNKESTPTFDDILSNKDMQAEFDRRVEKAIKTSKGKWETEMQKKQAEAERRAKMTAEEKLKEREEYLARKEAELERTAKINRTKEMLGEKELPTIFAEHIVLGSEEEEEIEDKIRELQEQFSLAVEQSVKQKMAGTTPTKTKAKTFVQRESRAF